MAGLGTSAGHPGVSAHGPGHSLPLTGAVAVDPYIRGRTKKLGARPAPRGPGEAGAVPGHESARNMTQLEQADARGLVPVRGLCFGIIPLSLDGRAR